MAKDKYGGHTPMMESTIGIGRKGLSDITNTRVRLASSLTEACEGALSTPLNKGNVSHFVKEIALLKKLLAEKEATIESQALQMKKLWTNSCRASQQNRQLIKVNSEISKELAFEQEKLKLLQHEYKQMSAMFKAKIAELEEKANDRLQQLRDMQERQGKNRGKNKGEQVLMSKLTFSTHNTNSFPSKSGDMCNGADGSFKLDEPANEDNLSDKRICLRRRAAKISYKEPLLNKKLRQHNQSEFLSTQILSESSCKVASFRCLDNLKEVCEDEVLHITDVLPSDPTAQDVSVSKCIQDPPASTELCRPLDNSFFSNMSISGLRGKATRVKLEPSELEEQEGHGPSRSSLNVVLETTQPSRKSVTGRPMRKAAEIIVSYKEIPLNVKLRRPA